MSAALSITETPAEVLERLREERAKRERARANDQIQRAIEKELLRARFEGELGPEGSEFGVIDTGHLGDPLVVVKRPALVQWTKWEQSRQTPVDRYDFVIPSVVHPTKDEYNVLREQRYGAEMQASNMLAKLLGLVEVDDQGK